MTGLPVIAGSSDQRMTDPWDRRVEGLRISVADACDLRCVDCVPEGSGGLFALSHTGG